MFTSSQNLHGMPTMGRERCCWGHIHENQSSKGHLALEERYCGKHIIIIWMIDFLKYIQWANIFSIYLSFVCLSTSLVICMSVFCVAPLHLYICISSICYLSFLHINHLFMYVKLFYRGLNKPAPGISMYLNTKGRFFYQDSIFIIIILMCLRLSNLLWNF